MKSNHYRTIGGSATRKGRDLVQWPVVLRGLLGSGRCACDDDPPARPGDEHFRALFEHAPVGMALCRLDGAFVDVNRAVLELLDGTGVDPATGSVADLAAASDPAAGEPAGPAWDRALDDVRRRRVDVARLDLPVRLRGGDTANGAGTVRWVGLTAARIELGRDPYLLVHLDDITPRRQEEQRLARLALRDGLTGLANRTLITLTLDEALERAAATGLRVGVLFLDLDGFKHVNDTLGHETGDTLLVAVARRLVGTLRVGDVAGRLGGDEFLVVAEGVASEAALEDLVRRVDAAVREPLVLEGRQVPLGASVGAVLSRRGDTGTDVVRRADAAMFAAKRARRRAVQRFVARPRATPLAVEATRPAPASDHETLARIVLHEQAVVAGG